MKTLFFLLIMGTFLSAQSTNSKTDNSIIKKLSWLEGAFDGKAWDGIIEESWSAPVGNSLIGMYRYIKNNEIVFSEFMYIIERNDSLILRLKHFNNDLTGWEEKDKFKEFSFVEIKDDEIIFDGLRMKKLSDSCFMSIVKLKDKSTGTLKEMEFIYSKKFK